MTAIAWLMHLLPTVYSLVESLVQGDTTAERKQMVALVRAIADGKARAKFNGSP